MRTVILFISIVFGLSAQAQNYLDSLLNKKGVCYLSLVQLEKMGIKEIRIYSFLSEEEIRRLPSKKEIRSRVSVYKFEPAGRLKELVKNYTGVDSLGVNRITLSGDHEDVLINGMVYRYDASGKITSTLSYGAGVTPNSGYIYDHEGQLVMIRYYYEKVMHRFSESAGRTIFDYYPQNGKLKYKIKLDNNGAIEKAEYYIYDNVWNLKGISNTPENKTFLTPYKPYTDYGRIVPWQVTIDKVPLNNFLFNNNMKNCNSVLIQVAPVEYHFFGL